MEQRGGGATKTLNIEQKNMKRISYILLLMAMPLWMGAQEVTDSIAPHNILKGTCLGGTAVGDEAILKVGTDGLGFYPMNAKAVLKANTAYVLSELLMLIDLSTLDNPTGIAPVHLTAPTDDRLYDLQGRRVEAPAEKGIYLKRGKKMILK